MNKQIFLYKNGQSPAQTIYLKCRSRMGFDIERIPMPNMRRLDQYFYAVEKLLAKKPIIDILDFAGVCYYALESHQDAHPSLVDSLKQYIVEVNTIFREESMCYEMHHDGRICYYPDDEFHAVVKSTLVILSQPEYQDNLKSFNDVLNDLYKNYCKESPIHELFKCIETFSLSLINDNKFKILNDSSVDTLMNKIQGLIDSAYATYNKEAASYMRVIFSKWVSMCHKYRHGKANQVNNSVPAELFNSIFTLGVSIFRFLLEVNDRYAIKL